MGQLTHVKHSLPALEGPEAVAYLLWQREAKREADRRAMALAESLRQRAPRLRGQVLTEAGWVIARGPLNRRLIDQNDKPEPASWAEMQNIADWEVNAGADAHEHAVKRGDMLKFHALYRDGALPSRYYCALHWVH